MRLPDSDYELTEDLRVGDVLLPSGRVIVGEYLFELEPLGLDVASGAYPAHATLARYRDQDFDSVAFASLVFSDAPTVRWEDGDFIAVDGGTTTITSVEGRDETCAPVRGRRERMDGSEPTDLRLIRGA